MSGRIYATLRGILLMINTSSVVLALLSHLHPHSLVSLCFAQASRESPHPSLLPGVDGENEIPNAQTEVSIHLIND